MSNPPDASPNPAPAASTSSTIPGRPSTPSFAAASSSSTRQQDAGLRRRTILTKASSEDFNSGTPSSLRRSSSIITDSSVDRLSSVSYMRQAAFPGREELHEEPGLWQSAPLLFAVVPAIAGVFFKRGSVFLTDTLLLLLAAVYLNRCLVTPWTWYHNAQTVHLVEDLPGAPVFEDEDGIPEEGEEAAEKPDEGEVEGDEGVRQGTSSAEVAQQELRLHELSALAMCFLGPLIGAYLLHVLRTQMSSFGDELVSNLHLTMFVLFAEIRPARHVVKMLHARTMYLQRVMREDPHAAHKQLSGGDDTLTDLQNRLDALQAAVSEKQPNQGTSPATEDAMKKQRMALQSQIDALTRAVRRYEKRATAQTIQTEARLQDLESRLRDAFSLAAVAASNSQKKGLIVSGLERLQRAVLTPLLALWAAFTYPFRLAISIFKRTMFKLGLLQPVSRRRAVQASRANGKARTGKARVSSGELR